MGERKVGQPQLRVSVKCPVCYLCPFANGHFPFAPSRAQTGTLQTGCKRDIPFVFSASSVPVCTPRSRGANGHSARTQTGSSRLCCVQVSCRQFFRKRTSRLLPTRRENAAQGDSTCGERRISLALAGVGAHFCHVATSSLPKIRRAVPICVADANGQGPVCAETHLRSSTERAPRDSLSPSTTSARPKRDRSRRAAWEHKRDTIVRRRGARAQMGTLHSPPRSHTQTGTSVLGPLGPAAVPGVSVRFACPPGKTLL